MGISTISGTSSGVIKHVAGTAIAAGDLVLNTESGYAYVANPSISVAYNNNSTAVVSVQYSTNLGQENSATTIMGTNPGAYMSDCAQLGNGNIVYVWVGNPSGNHYDYVNIAVRNSAGAIQFPTIVITDLQVYGNVRVKKLNSTSFVVAWVLNNGTVSRFAIYQNDGTVVKSSTTAVATTLYNGKIYHNLISNGNGQFVIVNTISSTGVVFNRFDSTGTLQGTQTTVTSGTYTISDVQALYQSSGGFVIVLSTSSGILFWRYDSTGTAQNSAVVVNNSSSGTNCLTDSNRIIELSNGNFAIQHYTGTYVAVAVYSSTAVLINNNVYYTSAMGYTSSYGFGAMCATSNGFAIVNFVTSGNANRLNTFDNTGKSLIQGATFVVNFQWNSTIYGALFNNGASGFTITTSGVLSGCISYTFGTVVNLNSSGAIVGSVVNTYYVGNAYSGATQLSDGNVAYFYKISGGNSYNMLLLTQRKSVLGVAQNTVSSGGTVSVATLGTFTINQSLSAGGGFDNRTATIPGTRGSVIGNTAVLFGLS